jgi:hypothetical protein
MSRKETDVSRRGFRLLLAFVVACACVVTLATAKPRPTAGPSPTPSPSPTPTPVFAPKVVIYPFETTGGLQRNSGAAIAYIFARAIIISGGVTVLPAPRKIVRADYGTQAQKLGADYYISGYLTPLGDGASMVEQIVGVQNGIIIYSNTAQLVTVADAASQALSARQIVLAHSGRVDHAYQAKSGTSTAGASVHIGGLGSLFNIFHHKRGSTTQAIATPVTKPQRVALVERIDGQVDGGSLASGTQALVAALDRHFHTTLSDLNVRDSATAANSVCGSNRNATVISGALSKQHRGFGSASVFTLHVYTCYGATLYQTTQSAGSIRQAVESAVDAYAAAHPQNS